MDQTPGYLIHDPVLDGLAALGACGCLDGPLHLLGARRVHRVGPAVLLVQHIAQRVIGALIARWRDVEAAARHQIHARRAKMQLHAVLMCVAHPQHVMALAIEAREGQFLEGVDDRLLLVLGRRIVTLEADDARAIAPLVRAGVDQVDHPLRIAAQHLGQRVAGDGPRLAGLIADQVAVLVIGQHLAVGQVVDRPRAAAFAVGKELDQHPVLSTAVARMAASWRSRLTSAVASVSASCGPSACRRAEAFARRAIWLRLPPIRPSASTTRGSTRGTGLRRRACASPRASRNSSAADRPAASALARSSAFSASVQRKTMVALRGCLARVRPAPVGFEGEACHPSQGPVASAPAYDMGRLAVCAGGRSACG